MPMQRVCSNHACHFLGYPLPGPPPPRAGFGTRHARGILLLLLASFVSHCPSRPRFGYVSLKILTFFARPSAPLPHAQTQTCYCSPTFDTVQNAELFQVSLKRGEEGRSQVSLMRMPEGTL